MAQLNVTPLSWVYIGLSVGWTFILLGGMLFLQRHRNLPCLQIRRLPLVFAAICSLHLYGVFVMLVYTIMPVFNCNAEFWIMSIYLPFGIALFQAANSQFLHTATAQKRFVHLGDLKDGAFMDHIRPPRATSRRQRLWRRVWGANRTMTYVGIGLFVQTALVTFVFFGSKKFHPSYGFFETNLSGVGQVRRTRCAKGWEWWISIAWQFFWSWIYAPYILWKSRRVRDVNGWRVQTICCCLAGMPASPLWLIGLYVPQMETFNKYFVPPQWFAVSIFFIEIFTIFFPCWQVMKTHSLQRETLDEIAAWEKRNPNYNGSGTVAGDAVSQSTILSGITTKTGQTKMTVQSSGTEKSGAFSMVALEQALQARPDDLLRFAALKDFSGENVSFLVNLASWKQDWVLSKGLSEEELRRQQFITAVRLYATFIRMEFSEFPINLSCQQSTTLHDVFGPAAAILCRSRFAFDSAVPFDAPSRNSSTTDFKTGLNLHTLGQANLRSVREMAAMGNGDESLEIEVPAASAFRADIFDAAEREIKYLVLTNTWPKFILEGNKTEIQKRFSITSCSQGLRRYFRAL